jgi:hypothetical protein
MRVLDEMFDFLEGLEFLNALHDSDLTRVQVITVTPVTDTEATAFFIALALHVVHGALEELCLLRETTT